MAARRMAAPGAEAAAFDPCLEAIAEGPRRWRDGVDRAAKARRAETKRVGPAPDFQMRQHQRIDLLKVTRAIGKIDRDAVAPQRHPAPVEEIGRGSGRESVCQYGSVSVAGVQLKKKKKK